MVICNYHHDRIACHHFCMQNPLCARAKKQTDKQRCGRYERCGAQHDLYTTSDKKKVYKDRYNNLKLSLNCMHVL